MKYIKTRDALQAFYYLIAVDGSVRDDERALFDHIGDNLDAKHSMIIAKRLSIRAMSV